MTPQKNDKPSHVSGPVRVFHAKGKSGRAIGVTPDHIIAKCTPCRDAQGQHHAKGNARLLAASYNTFDNAAQRLGVNAVELAEALQGGELAALIIAASKAESWLRSMLDPRTVGVNKRLALPDYYELKEIVQSFQRSSHDPGRIQKEDYPPP